MAAGDLLLNVNQNAKERPLRICKIYANNLHDVSEVKAGDIAAAIGLKSTRTGDTIINLGTKPVELKGIVTPPPVFFCSIEPSKTSEEKNLNEALRLLQMEDPTFHFNTDPGT